MNRKNKSWPESLKHAFAGIRRTAAKERNFRIQIFAGIAAVSACIVLQVYAWHFMLVAFAIFFVLSTELMNTAVEALTDLICQGKPHPLAKTAKDAAAGAVLLASAFALTTAGIIATSVVGRIR